MNLARGRELGITKKVDKMTYALYKPPKEWYEGERVGGGTVGSIGTGGTGGGNNHDNNNDNARGGTVTTTTTTAGDGISRSSDDDECDDDGARARRARAQAGLGLGASSSASTSSSSSSLAASGSGATAAHAGAPPQQQQPQQRATTTTTWTKPMKRATIRRGVLDLANWMGELVESIADVPLHKVRMPGTHDSGAYKLSKRRMGDLPAWLRGVNSWSYGVATRPITGIMVGWGEAQGLDVYEQCRHGARYLDLRVVHEQGKYFTAHGMAGASFQDILGQVRRFLDEHPKEVVICDFNHFHRFECAEDHFGFLAIVEECLGHHMAPLALRRASSSGGTVTYRELLSAGRRAVCMYGGWDFRGVARHAVEVGCWGRALHDLWSPWPRARSFSQLLERVTALDQDGAHASGFFVLQGVVTPDARRIGKSLFMPDWDRPRTLKQLARKVTPRVSRLVAGGALRARCIVMVDFIEEADVEGMLLSLYGAPDDDHDDDVEAVAVEDAVESAVEDAVESAVERAVERVKLVVEEEEGDEGGWVVGGDGSGGANDVARRRGGDGDGDDDADGGGGGGPPSSSSHPSTPIGATPTAAPEELTTSTRMLRGGVGGGGGGVGGGGGGLL